jgi:uncharacterized protein
MKVDLEKTFPLPGSAEVAWGLLQDVEAVASCMPGAKITEKVPDGGYKGTVTVKLGPATMAFRGEISVRDQDPATRSLRLLGRGTDSTGTSGASMDLAARIEDAPGGSSQLIGRSEVTMSGKAAAFGGRMMNSVADQILKQFGENFGAQVAARATRPAATGTPATQALPAAQTMEQTAEATAGDVCSISPPEPELNGLSILWAAFKDWLRSVFQSRAT